MDKTKTLNTLLGTIIFLILSIFFGGEYIDHQSVIQTIETSNSETIQQAETFTLNDVVELEEVDFFYTPYMKLNDQIVQKISSAKKRVYLEVYMFTETRILGALKKAHKKGVEVKVVLEKFPYMAPTLNNKLYEELQNVGIQVVRSNSKNYKLNHAKFLVIDKEAYISTGNMTYSTFKHNRDFFIFIKDTGVVQTLTQIFHNDFSGLNGNPYHSNLVVSPLYSRNKITTLLNSAEKDIKIYMQYFYDDAINILLKQIKKEKNINIEILVDKSKIESDEVLDLINSGITVNTIKNKIHAKAILIDDSYLFIGSENFSKSSLDRNREVGVILKNKEVIQKFLDIFKTDKSRANILLNG